MRFKITLQPLDPLPVLPISYQYEMSGWIYRMLSAGEPALAKFLHTSGYGIGSRRFKFFSFSHLNVPKWQIENDRLIVRSSEISFQIAFLEDKAATGLIGGLLKKATPFSIGDKISKARFTVRGVENLVSELPKSETVRLRTTSPMFVVQPKVNSNGKIGKQFLSPIDPAFEEHFTRNLREKYAVARKERLVGEVPADNTIQFKLLSEKPRKKGIRIKAFTPEETHNIGYLFDFQLTAPKEIIRLGLLAGLGSLNSMGFGAAEVIA